MVTRMCTGSPSTSSSNNGFGVMKPDHLGPFLSWVLMMIMVMIIMVVMREYGGDGLDVESGGGWPEMEVRWVVSGGSIHGWLWDIIFVVEVEVVVHDNVQWVKK